MIILSFLLWLARRTPPLFMIGPIVQSWGFWDRASKRFTPWRKFLGLES